MSAGGYEGRARSYCCSDAAERERARAVRVHEVVARVCRRSTESRRARCERRLEVGRKANARPRARDARSSRGCRAALAMRNRSPASTPQPSSWSAATVASSCATGIQTLSPAAAVRTRCLERRAPRAVPLCAACSTSATRSAWAACIGVVPERDHQTLEQMRDPAGGDQPSPLDPRNRGRVAGEDGEPQVRAEGLRHRAQMHPPRTPRLTERVARPFCDIEGMIILDDEHRRDGAPARCAIPRARSGVDRGAEGVLRARRQRTRDGAAAQRAGQTLGRRSAIVDRHRDDGEAERGCEVDDPRVARVLHRDPVAGTEMRHERELHAVERAADDGDVVAGDAVAHRGALPRARSAPGRTRRCRRASARGATRRSAGPRSGSSAGSGLPESRSRTPAGTIGRPRGDGGTRGAMLVPSRPAPATSPRRRSSRYAEATVAVLMPRCEASDRTVGRRVPAVRSPSRIPRSMLSAISEARRPVM